MHSTTRTTRNLATTLAVVASGLLIASAAEAGGSNRGERINARLDVFAWVAAVSGDPRIERRYDRSHRFDRHQIRHHRHRRLHGLHHAGCGHAVFRTGWFIDRGRSHHRGHHDRPKRGHREKKGRH